MVNFLEHSPTMTRKRPRFSVIACIAFLSLLLQYHVLSLFTFKESRDGVEFVPDSVVLRMSHQHALFHRRAVTRIPPTLFNDSMHYNLFPPHSRSIPTIQKKPKLKKINLTIHVFAWKRAKSLRRLLDSLVNADYKLDQDPIRLIIHVDGNPSQSVLDIIHDFEWVFGPDTWVIKKHSSNVGLKRMMLSAWDLTDASTHALFLEDDVSVSPLFASFAIQCARHFLTPIDDSELNQSIMGCSLYTPRLDEISHADDPQHPPLWNPSDLVGSDPKIVLYQLPCSWGAVYEKEHWFKFVKYLQHRIDTPVALPAVPNSRSNDWNASWKRFLIEFMYAKGWTLVYPNFKDQKSFSTNYYEEGIHSVPDTMKARVPDVLRTTPDARFQVPLFERKDAASVFNLLPKTLNERMVMAKEGKIPVISLFNQRVSDLDALKDASKEWLKQVHRIDGTSYSLLTI